MNVRDRKFQGDYETKIPCPTKPRVPDLLRKTVASLSTDELARVVQVKAEYEAALDRHTADVVAYREDVQRLRVVFRRDVETEHGMTGHPKANQVWDMAQDFSDNDDEFFDIYDRLCGLVK
jgi:cytochrome c556